MISTQRTVTGTSGSKCSSVFSLATLDQYRPHGSRWAAKEIVPEHVGLALKAVPTVQGRLAL